MPTLSIIIPIYNAEKYIRRCIDSILSQTYSDFELILVNDGSKDNSGSICEEYAQKDSRVRVFHNSNKGVSYSRNYGINKARGEWIGFVDADDWLNEDMYAEMLNEANAGDAELVMTEFYRVEREKINYASIPVGELDVKMFIHKYVFCGYTVVWNIIVKKQIIVSNGIRFDDSLRIGEDFEFVLSLLVVVRGIAVVRKPLYNYECRNEDSALHKMKFEDYEQVLKAIGNTMEFYKKTNNFEEFEVDFYWKILNAKQELVLYPDKHDEFLRLYPLSHNHIHSNPLIGKKIKIMMSLLIHHLGIIVTVINYMRFIRPLNRERRKIIR